MYHRNIVSKPAAAFTREAPLVISTGDKTVTFTSSAVPFSASVKKGKTYYFNAECGGCGHKWAQEDADGRKMSLYAAVNGIRLSTDGKPCAITPTSDGTLYFNIVCEGAGAFKAWNFSVVEHSSAVEYAPNPDAVDASEGEIKIYNPKSAQASGGSALGIFPLISSSVRKKEFMGTDTVKLYWDDTCEEDETPLAIPLGSYVIVDGMKFRCLTQYMPQQTNELVWQYEVEFHAPVSALSVKPFFFYMEELCETEFNINGEFKEFTDALVTAIQKTTGETWSISAPEDLGTRSLSFSQTTIFDAIRQIADEFDVEWLATADSITFIKDASSSEARILVVGSDISAPSQSSSGDDYYNRYYAFGSTRNIVRTDYSTLNASVTSLSEPRLKLPTEAWTDEDGRSYPACPGGYVDYDDGSGADYTERNACVKVYDDIYPQSDLVVSSVSTTTKKNEDGEQYPVYTLKMTCTSDGSEFKINNSTYNKDGNPDGQLISGMTVSINFTSGLLQGKEFEIGLSADGKSLTIVPDTSEEIMVPNTLIIPQVGDKCIVFNIRMPDSYRVSAEHKLYKQLMEDIAKAHSESAALTLTSYPDANITGLDVADKLVVKNGATATTTRVVSIEQPLDMPASWTITTGEAVRTSKVRTMTETVGNLSGAVASASKSAVLANRAAWKSSQELLDQVFDPEGDFFTERIKPLVVETANVTVGTKSQQFVIDNLVFGFNNGVSEGVAPYFFAKAQDSNTTPKLHHYAIDPDAVRTWSLNKSYVFSYGNAATTLGSAFSFSADTAGCYIYAVCQRFDGVDYETELNGYVLLSDKQILAEPSGDAGHYYFLLGMLSSEITTYGYISRNVTLTFGETTINGRNITTGRIQSADGSTYFDLDRGEIGGNIIFTAPEGSANETLINSIISGNSTVASASSNASSALSTANSAASTATSAKSAIDNLKVGGRNLLPMSTYVGNSLYSVNKSEGWLQVISKDTRTWSYANCDWKGISLKGGTTYCFSVEVQTAGDGSQLQIWTESKVVLNVFSWNSSVWGGDDTTGVFYWTYTPSEDCTVGVMCKAFSTRVQRYKLEEGTIPTAWTPAPEDVDSGIAAAQSTANSANTNASNAVTTANKASTNASNAVTTANSASTNASNAVTTANKASTNASNAVTTANKANTNASNAVTTANAAKSAVDNFQVGGRNLVSNSGKSYKLDYTSSSNACIIIPLVSGAANMVFSDSNVYCFVSYYVDNWVEDYAPNFNGINLGCTSSNTSGWDWYNGNSSVKSGYIQINATTRRYWFKLKSAGFRLLRLWLYSNNANGTPTNGIPSVYNVMLSFGSALADYQAAPEDTNYLKEALIEATASTTDISGGLVLSKFIGVRNESGTIVAGMSGTTAATAGNLPMMWAGADDNTDAGLKSAKFTVLNTGHVEMSDVNISSSGDGIVNINNGAIIASQGANSTQLLSSSIGSITSAVSNAGGGTQPSQNKSDSGTLTIDNTANYSYGGSAGVSKSFTQERTYSTTFTPGYNGYMTVSVSSGTTAALDCYIFTADYSNCFVRTSSGSMYSDSDLWKISSSSSITSSTLSVKVGTTAQTASDGKYTITKNTTYTVSVTYKMTVTVTIAPDTTKTGTSISAWSLPSAQVKGSYKQTSTITIQPTSTEYINKIYADGLHFAKESRYFGVCSTSTPVFQTYDGGAYLKFTSSGLLQSFGGSSWYRANPLVLILRMTYTSSTSTIKVEAKYNPGNIASNKFKVSRSDVGLYVINHGLGHSSYSVSAIANDETNQRMCCVTAYDSTTITIGTSDDSSRNDVSWLDVLFYDYRKF